MLKKKIQALLLSFTMVTVCTAPAVEVYAQTDITVYGSEDYLSKSDLLTVNKTGHVLDNGSIAELKASSLPEEKLFVTYALAIPEDGEYTVSISASKYDIASLSEYAVYVDDNEPFTVNADNVLSSAAHPDGGNYARYLGIFDLNLTYELSAGEHTFTFLITKPRSNGAVYAFFEYFSLTKSADEPDDGPVEDIFIYGSGAYSEKSELMTLNTATHELNNGYTARYTGASLDENGILYITYPFSVKRAGSYMLTISAGKYDVNHLSSYAFSFDGADDINMNSSVVANTAVHPDGGNFALLMAVFDTNIICDFEPGAHTLTFKITGLRSQGNAYQFMEYFKLKYIDEGAMLSEVSSLIDAIGEVTAESKEAIDAARAAYDSLLEYLKPQVINYDVLLAAERAYNRIINGGGSNIIIYGSDAYLDKSEGLTYAISELFDNGKVVALRSGTLPDGGLTITYGFDVIIPGKYTLYLSSPKYTNIYMSSYAVSVDNGLYKDIGDAVVEKAEAHPMGGSYAEYLCRYKTKLQYDLDEGTHFITMKITSLRSNGDVYDFLEYFRFVLDEEISSVAFESDEVYAEIGEPYTVKLTAIGAVSEDNVDISDAETEYTSLSPEVAAIDESGTVTPVAFGEAVVQARVSYKSFSDTVSMKIKVCANGIYCEPKGYYSGEDNRITSLSDITNKLSSKAVIYNMSEETKKAIFVLALFNNRALEKYDVKSYDIAAGQSVDVQTVIDGIKYSEGMSAEIFFWSSKSVPSPIGDAGKIQ